MGSTLPWHQWRKTTLLIWLATMNSHRFHIYENFTKRNVQNLFSRTTIQISNILVPLKLNWSWFSKYQKHSFNHVRLIRTIMEQNPDFWLLLFQVLSSKAIILKTTSAQLTMRRTLRTRTHFMSSHDTKHRTRFSRSPTKAFTLWQRLFLKSRMTTQ